MALETKDLSIRFVNTVAWRLREPHEERLGSPTVLLSWLEWNGLARSKDLRLIRKVWSADPRKAPRVYKMAIQLREAAPHQRRHSAAAGGEMLEAAGPDLTRVIGRAGWGLRSRSLSTCRLSATARSAEAAIPASECDGV